MNTEEIKELLVKATQLEKIIMRPLDDREVDYLKDHSVYDFLYDVLGFDSEDLSILLKLQKAISDWCTRPTTAFDLDDIGWNLYTDTEESEYDIDLFKDTPVDSTKKVISVLSTLISELQEELNKYQAEEESRKSSNEDIKFSEKEIESLKENAPKEKTSKVSTYPDSEKQDGFELDAGDDFKPSQESCILKCLPHEIIEWARYLVESDLLWAASLAYKACPSNTVNLDAETIATPGVDDEFIATVVDNLKDKAILNIVESLKEGNTELFYNEDIQMEVLDYLYKNNYKVKSINNSVSLL